MTRFYVYYSAHEPVNMTSAAQRASTIIDEMIKEKEISILPNLAIELTSEQKFLSSSSAAPKPCGYLVRWVIG